MHEASFRHEPRSHDPLRDQREAIAARAMLADYERALAAIYPVVERVLGEVAFAAFAAGFARAIAFATGDVGRLGRDFAFFLDAHEDETEVPYLADLARLEWAIAEAASAPDARALDLARLALVPEAEHPSIAFSLHPSVRVVESRFPIERLWRAHQVEPGDEGVAFGRPGGQVVLVHRAASRIVLRELDPAGHALVRAFAHGATLERAAIAAEAADPALDLSARIVALVKAGVLSDLAAAAP